jgi:16S rRNA (adenine1518-N6/adenine1519-N6)-dimethyltransferase
MPQPLARHRPRRRFGQHFLHDRGVIDRIVTAIDPRPGDRLLEIGPGEGALTWPLLARAGSLDVVETDRDLAAALEGHPGLRVHTGDALDFDYAALAGGGPALRLVGNLPYNISTPLLFRLIAARGVIRDMHFMLQREVVERLVAAPGDEAYGRLGVMVALDWDVRMLFTVGPGAFRPAPRVTSAVARFTPRPEPAVTESQRPILAEVVRRLFSARRKTLRNGLKGLLAPEAIEAAGIDPGLRPERLSLEAFLALARAVARERQGETGERA